MTWINGLASTNQGAAPLRGIALTIPFCVLLPPEEAGCLKQTSAQGDNRTKQELNYFHCRLCARPVADISSLEPQRRHAL